MIVNVTFNGQPHDDALPLDAYDPAAFPPFAVTTDLVILTVRPPSLEVLLVKRTEEPFAGSLALPGGFVGVEQDLVDAARFKLTDKTGIEVDGAHLEQLATFGSPTRDPRMRVVSVAYLAMVADPPPVTAGPDGAEAAWHSIRNLDLAALAFDHAEVLSAGVERARSKLEYTTLATTFCGAEFTMAELRTVYETVWNVTLDPPNFHRKVLATGGFVEPTGRTVGQGKGRPAKTYTAGPADTLSPPLNR